MNIMHFVNEAKNSKLLKKVTYLDGFLGALAAANGRINQYFARIILLEATKESLESSLDDYFKGRCTFKFKNIELIDNKPIRVLELELREFILSCSNFSNNEDILNKKKYLSFHILDLVDFLELGDDFKLYLFEEDSDHKIYALFYETNIALLFLLHKNY